MESTISYAKDIKIEKSTDRLYIRSYTEDDYENCLSLYSDPILTQFFDHGKPRTKLEIDRYIEKRGRFFLKKDLPFGLFSVFLSDRVTFIGQVYSSRMKIKNQACQKILRFV